MINRRRFLSATASAAVFARVTRSRAAGYDIVIKGGRVIDPSLGIDAVRDVAVVGGRIAAVETDIAAGGADVIDAHGKIVAPGLIDIHCHCRVKEMPSLVLGDGVTAFIDAGSQGADNIDASIAIAKTGPNLGRVLINIARTGITGKELMDISQADVAAARAAIARHRDMVVGIKARLSRDVAGDNDLEALQRAQDAAAPFNLPVMIHMGQTVSPLPKVLALLKRGDVVTHMYAPPPNGILDEDGRLLPEVLAARRRGVWFRFRQRPRRTHPLGRRRTRDGAGLPAQHPLDRLEPGIAHLAGVRPADRDVEIPAARHAAAPGDRLRHRQCVAHLRRVQRSWHAQCRRPGRRRRDGVAAGFVRVRR